MKKILVILVILAITFWIFAPAYADQDGEKIWCNIDEYGCWVTDKDDEGKSIHSYIQFWTEEARDFILGNKKDAVVAEKPTDTEEKDKMELKKAKKRNLSTSTVIKWLTVFIFVK